MIDNDYINSMKAWFADMKLTIEQTRHTISFHEKEISLHTAMLTNLNELQGHDIGRAYKASMDFEKYLNENGATPEELQDIRNWIKQDEQEFNK
jgi:hypothetical protein